MKVLFFLAIIAFISCTSPGTVQSDTSDNMYEEEVEKVKQLRIDFQEGWIAGDSSAVMSLMSEDIVFLPHHGDSILIGRDVLADYWFNPDYPPTEVLKYSEKFVGAHVSGEVGYTYGRFILEYNYDGKNYTNAGNFLTVCRKLDGEWKISNLIFNDPQPTVRDL